MTRRGTAAEKRKDARRKGGRGSERSLSFSKARDIIGIVAFKSGNNTTEGVPATCLVEREEEEKRKKRERGN
ncbi:hypothetical protein E2C01_037759 [Portunus trituberculatus]|uniref:Uncharacterized protein n=1 Tax=Portunus trituberculatus TaxID=210409 RepID=A0A5B7FFF9_PORTR|nr:hypothetical protein [Portunus trituberculatus]